MALPDVLVYTHTLPYSQGDLEKLFSKDLEFSGSFAFHRVYPEAPNPLLSIEGLGTVGLPLSDRDAKAIKERAEQAPFGMADRTVVDKNVRDTWEIDAKQVSWSIMVLWSKRLIRLVHRSR